MDRHSWSQHASTTARNASPWPGTLLYISWNKCNSPLPQEALPGYPGIKLHPLCHFTPVVPQKRDLTSLRLSFLTYLKA